MPASWPERRVFRLYVGMPAVPALSSELALPGLPWPAEVKTYKRTRKLVLVLTPYGCYAVNFMANVILDLLYLFDDDGPHSFFWWHCGNCHKHLQHYTSPYVWFQLALMVHHHIHHNHCYHLEYFYVIICIVLNFSQMALLSKRKTNSK